MQFDCQWVMIVRLERRMSKAHLVTPAKKLVAKNAGDLEHSLIKGLLWLVFWKLKSRSRRGQWWFFIPFQLSWQWRCSLVVYGWWARKCVQRKSKKYIIWLLKWSWLEKGFLLEPPFHKKQNPWYKLLLQHL